jgi:hypothetical protein
MTNFFPPFAEQGKPAPFTVKSKPRVLSRVKVSDVPEIRPSSKYGGFLGPNYSSQSKKRSEKDVI